MVDAIEALLRPQRSTYLFQSVAAPRTLLGLIEHASHTARDVAARALAD